MAEMTYRNAQDEQAERLAALEALLAKVRDLAVAGAQYRTHPHDVCWEIVVLIAREEGQTEHRLSRD